MGEGAKLDDMLDTPRLSEVAEEELDELQAKLNDLDVSEDEELAAREPSRDVTQSRDVTPRNITQSRDVAVETQQEMAKVTLECGLQVGGYDVDAQTHISTDFWDDLDRMKYSNEDIIHPSEILVDDKLIPVLPQINIPVLKVSATTPIQTDEVLSVPDLQDLAKGADSTQSVVMEGDEQSFTLEGKEEDDVTEVTAKIVDDDDTLSSSSSSSSSSKHSRNFFSSDSDSEKDVKKKKPEGKPEKKEDSGAGFSKGLVVLARWSDEGWYFRGKIVEPSKGGYIVEDNGGHVEDIDHRHILVDEQVGHEIYRCFIAI